MRARSPRVKCCAPLGPPSTTAQRGAGSAGKARVGRGARGGEPRAARTDAARSASSAHWGRDSESCSGIQIRSISRAGIARDPAERRVKTRDPARALQRADIGHRHAPAGDHDIRQRPGEIEPRPRRSLRVDRAVGRQPREQRARLDARGLIGRAQAPRRRPSALTSWPILPEPSTRTRTPSPSSASGHARSQAHLARQPLGEALRQIDHPRRADCP